MYFLGKSSPTTPTSLTGEKKLAATAAWLAEPPSRRGFSAVGVLMESSAVEPTMSTLIKSVNALAALNQFDFVAFGRVNEGEPRPGRTRRRAVGILQAILREMLFELLQVVHQE